MKWEAMICPRRGILANVARNPCPCFVRKKNLRIFYEWDHRNSVRICKLGVLLCNGFGTALDSPTHQLSPTPSYELRELATQIEHDTGHPEQDPECWSSPQAGFLIWERVRCSESHSSYLQSRKETRVNHFVSICNRSQQ